MRYKKILTVLIVSMVLNTCGMNISAEEMPAQGETVTMKDLEGELQILQEELRSLRLEIGKLREENQQLREELIPGNDGMTESTTEDASEQTTSAASETTEVQSEDQTEATTETQLETQTMEEIQTESRQEETRQTETSAMAAQEESAEETAAQEAAAMETTSSDEELVMMEPITEQPKAPEPISVVNQPDYHNLYIGSDLVVSVQNALNGFGYYCGNVDGVAGEETRRQIRAFQADHGLQTTGTITDELITNLLGLQIPGTGQEAVARTESDARIEDAGILQVSLRDTGRQEGGYAIEMIVSNQGASTVLSGTIRLVWYDQFGTLLDTTQAALGTLVPGANVQIGAFLPGAENSWNVAAVGVAGYEYTLEEPDAQGFTSCRINLQTGVVKGK